MISHMKGYSSELRRTIDLSEDPSGVLGQIASLCPKSKECRITILSSDGRKTLARWGSISSTFSESSEAILTTGSLSLIIRCEVDARSEGR